MSNILIEQLPWYNLDNLPEHLVNRFSRKELDDFLESFLLFDKDSDGVITTKEVMTVLRSVGKEPDPDDIQHLMKDFDLNGDGCVEFSEFLELMLRMQDVSHTEQELVEIFRVLDQDGDGNISKADLREIIIRLRLTSELSNQDLDEMIDEADKDGDGCVGFQEFVKTVMDRV